MRSLIHSVLASCIAIVLLAACKDKSTAPAPFAELMRPVLTLDVKSNQLQVPQSLLVERGGIPGVFVLADDARARFRMVRTGKRANGRIEILSGLSGSETLVAGNLRAVRDGSPIQVPRIDQLQQHPSGQGN